MNINGIKSVFEGKLQALNRMVAHRMIGVGAGKRDDIKGSLRFGVQLSTKWGG